MLRPADLNGNTDYAGFDFRLVSAYVMGLDVAHEHGDVRQVLRHLRWTRFAADVTRHWAGEGFSGYDIELGVVHGAGEYLTVERALFERGVHMPAPPFHGMEAPVNVTDDDLVFSDFN